MKSNTLIELNPKDISEQEGFNTRYDLGDLRELKASMTLKGFDPSEPLIVRKNPDKEGKFLLGAQGHRRLTVAQELGLKTVYAVLEDESLSDADRNLDIVRLNSGEPLPMLAVARVIGRALVDETVKQSDLAKLLGKSPTFVNDCTKLLQTTKQTQKRIEQDKIAAYAVVELIKEMGAKTEEDFEKIEAAVEKLIGGSTKKVTKTKAKKSKSDDGKSDEQVKEEREKAKARKKELEGYEKRVVKFAEDTQATVKWANELGSTEELTPFQDALLNYQVSLASFLMDKGTDTSRLFTDKGEADKLSDVAAASRALEKAHKETVKETKTEVKQEVQGKADEKIDALKEKLTETKEQAAERIAAAKAKK